jgi:hypothetical protein
MCVCFFFFLNVVYYLKNIYSSSLREYIPMNRSLQIKGIDIPMIYSANQTRSKILKFDYGNRIVTAQNKR